MLDVDAEELRRMVKEAVEWSPRDKLSKIEERISRENSRQHPVIVRKCCRQCIFLNPNDTCENFQSPKKIPKRKTGEWIPIPPHLSESIYCEAWIDDQLTKLLLTGGGPSSIAYGRRHPNVEIPHNGLVGFAEHLASLSRKEALGRSDIANRGEDIEWPEMDERLRAILLVVEQNGNEEMWSQYQGSLFLMGAVPYINSMLDRLLQKPDSQIARFFEYVIDVHGYHYRGMFSIAGEQGAKTYERIVGLLNHPSKTIQDIAIRLLQTIAEHSYGEKPPQGSTDPRVWMAWGEKEFPYYWEKGN